MAGLGAPAPEPVIDPMVLGVGLGVLGGVFIGKAAVEHMFVEGFSDHERKNLLLFAASGFALWAAQTFFNIGPLWWVPAGVIEDDDQTTGGQ